MLTDVLVVSFTALITMVNPLAVVPSFVALTDGASWRCLVRDPYCARSRKPRIASR